MSLQQVKSQMDEEEVRAWPIEEKIAALEVVIHHRRLCELALVGILNRTAKNGDTIPKSLILEDLDYTIDSERKLVRIIGRKNAGIIYGKQEGLRSAVERVDFLFKFDFHNYYHQLIAQEQTQP